MNDDDVRYGSRDDFEHELGRVAIAFEELSALLNMADGPLDGAGVGALVRILADRLQAVREELGVALAAADHSVALPFDLGDVRRAAAEVAAGVSGGGRATRDDGLAHGSLAAALRDAGIVGRNMGGVMATSAVVEEER